MNSSLLVPLLVTTLVAIISWFVAHQLCVWRDLANKRRELRIQYLIDAYRRLEAGTNCELGAEEAKGLESAIADIQLFGTSHQVEKAQRFAVAFASAGGASINDLLDDLRNDLRLELRLDKVQTPLTHLRIQNSERPKNALHLTPPATISPASGVGLLGRRRR